MKARCFLAIESLCHLSGTSVSKWLGQQSAALSARDLKTSRFCAHDFVTFADRCSAASTQSSADTTAAGTSRALRGKWNATLGTGTGHPGAALNRHTAGARQPVLPGRGSLALARVLGRRASGRRRSRGRGLDRRRFDAGSFLRLGWLSRNITYGRKRGATLGIAMFSGSCAARPQDREDESSNDSHQAPAQTTWIWP